MITAKNSSSGWSKVRSRCITPGNSSNGWPSFREHFSGKQPSTCGVGHSGVRRSELLTARDNPIADTITASKPRSGLPPAQTDLPTFRSRFFSDLESPRNDFTHFPHNVKENFMKRIICAFFAALMLLVADLAHAAASIRAAFQLWLMILIPVDGSRDDNQRRRAFVRCLSAPLLPR